jgi:protein tyrosine/serine phosphatase
MQRWLHWSLVTLIVLMIGVAPFVYYRAHYAHSKRLRTVLEGKVYRSGQLTVEGFRDAISNLGIRTVVNLQEDYPNPDLARSYLDRGTIKEIDLCRELQVRYVFIAPDVLPRDATPAQRPEAIEKMLAVFDDPKSYPILIHCKAGLHRTGCMAAIYRMEFQGWTPQQAVEEMRAHGFGDKDCTAANDYVYQYVLSYRPGLRRGHPVAAKQ